MKRLLRCNLLFIKRCFKKISFIILLLAIPILCYMLKDSSQGSTGNLCAGIYLETESPLATEIVENLTSDYESVDFEVCNNLDTLKKRVLNGTYECGYMFPDNFDEKLSINDTNELVTVYLSPGTITSAITSEYIFSEISKKYTLTELIDYVKKDDSFNEKELKGMEEEITELYLHYLNGDETFTFEYITDGNTILDNTEIFSSYLLMSVKGIIALLIMIAAFLGTLNLYRDNKAGVFFAFSGITKTFAKMSEIFSTSCIACVSGLITIYLCGLSDGLMIEVTRLLIYAIICTMYCYIIFSLTPNQYVFTAMIPVLILGSIVFCPIFIDFSEVIPIVKYMAWLFAPTYYLL